MLRPASAGACWRRESVFWAGMIRVYLTSVQLGTQDTASWQRWCGWIPAAQHLVPAHEDHPPDRLGRSGAGNGEVGTWTRSGRRVRSARPECPHSAGPRRLSSGTSATSTTGDAFPGNCSATERTVYYGQQQSAACGGGQRPKELAARIRQIVEETGCGNR